MQTTLTHTLLPKNPLKRLPLLFAAVQSALFQLRRDRLLACKARPAVTLLPRGLKATNNHPAFAATARSRVRLKMTQSHIVLPLLLRDEPTNDLSSGFHCSPSQSIFVQLFKVRFRSTRLTPTLTPKWSLQWQHTGAISSASYSLSLNTANVTAPLMPLDQPALLPSPFPCHRSLRQPLLMSRGVGINFQAPSFWMEARSDAVEATDS
jgi:hypothetical protein